MKVGDWHFGLPSVGFQGRKRFQPLSSSRYLCSLFGGGDILDSFQRDKLFSSLPRYFELRFMSFKSGLYRRPAD